MGFGFQLKESICTGKLKVCIVEDLYALNFLFVNLLKIFVLVHVLCVSLLGLWVYLLGSICVNLWFNLIEVLDSKVFSRFQCFGFLGSICLRIWSD